MPYAVMLTAGRARRVAVARLEPRWPYALAKGAAAAGFVWLALVGRRHARPLPARCCSRVSSPPRPATSRSPSRPGRVPGGTAAFALAHRRTRPRASSRGDGACRWPRSRRSPGGRVAPRVARAAAPACRSAPRRDRRLRRARERDGRARVGRRSGRGPRRSLLGGGATAFYLSDLAVARERFVTRSFADKLWGLPLYYVAQVLIALSGPADASAGDISAGDRMRPTGRGGLRRKRDVSYSGHSCRSARRGGERMTDARPR